MGKIKLDLEKRSLIIIITFFTILILTLILPVFWTSYEYTGNLLPKIKTFIEIEDMPIIVQNIGLALLVISSVFYIILIINKEENRKFDEKIAFGAFGLGFAASILLLIINIYASIYIGLSINTWGSSIIYLWWHLFYIILDVFLISLILWHALFTDLINLKPDSLDLDDKEIKSLKLTLLFGILIMSITIIMIFLPNMWIPKAYAFDYYYGNSSESLSLQINLFDLIVLSYIFGLFILIITATCYIIIGIKNYSNLKDVGFGMGMITSITLVAFNLIGIIIMIFNIFNLPSSFLYDFLFYANVGFDVPPPPEKAFIFALFMSIFNLGGYLTNIIWAFVHLILNSIILILVIISYKRIFIHTKI
ncbi:MAG: hypothetical protein ACTSO9_21005 [Candidatus Helarchaeota archaeon]